MTTCSALYCLCWWKATDALAEMIEIQPSPLSEGAQVCCRITEPQATQMLQTAARKPGWSPSQWLGNDDTLYLEAFSCLSIFSICIHKVTKNMFFFFQWDPSQVKIAKPKHLLLINTDLAFDEKLKHAWFTELKIHSPLLSPLPISSSRKSSLKIVNVRLHVRLRFSKILATPAWGTNLTGGVGVFKSL